MDAVIDVGFGPSAPTVPRGGPSEGLEFHDFALDVSGKAWHGIRAYAIVRSLVSGLTVMGAIHVGVELGYGFIVRLSTSCPSLSFTSRLADFKFLVGRTASRTATFWGVQSLSSPRTRPTPW